MTIITIVLLTQSVLVAALLVQRYRQKRAEAQLMLSEHRYRQVVDSQYEMVCRYLADGTLTFVNEAYCRFFGKSREELLGSTFYDLIPAESHAAVLATIEKLKRNERSQGEHEVTLPDGEMGWMYWEDHPILDEHSRVVEFQGVGRDVTKRRQALESLRQSEERFAGIFHASPEAISIVSQQDGSFQEVNPSWERFFETDRAAAIGASPVELGLLGSPEAVARFRNFIKSGDSLTGFEHTIVTGKGKFRWTSVSCVLATLNGLSCYIVMNKDITLRREAEAAKDGLEHATKLAMLGELTASIAHEINQPLGAILSNTDSAEILLDRGPDSIPEIRQILSDIRRDDLRASAIIRKVRGMVAKRDMVLARLEINEVIRDVETLIMHDVRRHGVKLMHELTGEESGVMADRIQIEQVLMNLLLNAVDALHHVPFHERWIVIHSIRHNGTWIEVSIEDSGAGMEPDTIARIFDSFFTTKSTGMGLGLALSRSIVEAHGGRLTAENNPHVGATLRMLLPAIP